jgi:uncharacterized membrane protein
VDQRNCGPLYFYLILKKFKMKIVGRRMRIFEIFKRNVTKTKISVRRRYNLQGRIDSVPAASPSSWILKNFSNIFSNLSPELSN